MGTSTNLMAIFNSDVGFPEGREEKRSMSLDKHGKKTRSDMARTVWSWMMSVFQMVTSHCLAILHY